MIVQRNQIFKKLNVAKLNTNAVLLIKTIFILINLSFSREKFGFLFFNLSPLKTSARRGFLARICTHGPMVTSTGVDIDAVRAV